MTVLTRIYLHKRCLKRGGDPAFYGPRLRAAYDDLRWNLMEAARLAAAVAAALAVSFLMYVIAGGR